MEPSIQLHTLAKFVDDEDNTNENFRTLDLPLEINNVTSKLESQSLSAATYDSNPEVMVTQTTGPNIKNKFRSRKDCNKCHKSNQSVSNSFRKQGEEEERKRTSFSRSKSPAT